jgi:hypothetical protein
MSNIDKSNQLNLPGFESWPEMQHSVLPDYNLFLSKKTEQIKNGFDPHKLMVQKKQINSGEIASDTPKKEWPEKDIKTLEDFCTKNGIVGYNCGKMHPIAALAFLKQYLGIVDGSLEERVPVSYQKIGYKLNSDYTQSTKEKTQQKSVLHG